MTIVAGVACPEGLVLAADSRTSVADGRISTDRARKLFQLGADERFGAATWGTAVNNPPATGAIESK